ncbi:MAG: hypothetical protein J5625_05610 [Lachnospiraceae bacterium]|nr:hypothetical protein [Lachnospiraceae bacterium]
MRLFVYYAFHTIVNTLKKLLKTWVAFFIVITLVASLLGLLIGRLVPLIEKSFQSEETAIEQTIDEEEIEEHVSKLSEFLTERNLTKYDMVDMVVVVAFLFFVTLTIATVNKGGELFKPADVPLLFASPMKPQSVLMFRLMNSLGMNIVVGFYMIFQIPNLVNNLHISVWSAFIILLAYILTMLFSTLVQIAFYTLSRNSKKGTVNIGSVLIGFYAVLLVAFIAYTTITKQDVGLAAFKFFGSKHTFFIPFLGWIRGMVYYSMMGDVLRTVIFTALFVVACIVTVVVIWNVKADFYEDAMFATERVAAKLENAQKAQKGGTVTRNKDRSAKIERDGFHYGNGAGVFFYKAVYNRLRFATLKIFSKTFIINLLIAIGGSWLSSKINNPMLDPLLIPVAAIALFAFYRTMGNPLDEDTSREFFILIPDAPLKKIWASLLGAVTVCAIDISIPMIVAAVITKSNPLTLIGWFIFILSISLFGTTVGAFVSISIPGDHAQYVKMMVQIIFVYFGAMPSMGFVVAGLILKNMLIMLLIGAVFNLLAGTFFTLLTPHFLTNK